MTTIAPTAAIKSFALGYKATMAVVETTSDVVAASKDAATVTTSFFGGIRFAIKELRAKDEAPVTPESIDAEKLRTWNEAMDLFARAHPER
jgi:hypothetical protein